jgi:hypothetical protein
VEWTAPVFVGGSPIIDYRVSWSQSGGEYTTLFENLVATSFVKGALIAGETYVFRVEARTAYGFSLHSEELSLLCAYISEPPLVVTTTNEGDLVTVVWDEPINNGYVIHAYRVFILQSDGTTYTEESVQCEGSSAEVVAARQCQISLTALRSVPYNLAQGASVWAKVTAINIYGESEQSTAGNNALIQLVPEAPINLLKVPYDWNDVTNTEVTTD